MPLFTPDARRFVVGRPNVLWFAPQSERSFTLVRTADGEWQVFNTESDEVRAEFPHVFDSGRETYVTYQQVRDWDLTDLGRVRYVDDYHDQWTDVYISQINSPFARAATPEPVWSAE